MTDIVDGSHRSEKSMMNQPDMHWQLENLHKLLIALYLVILRSEGSESDAQYKRVTLLQNKIKCCIN